MEQLEPNQRLTGAQRRIAIVALSFGTGLVVTDNGIATVALPTIARSLDIDASDTVMVITIYQMVLLMTVLPFSALGDRIGLKRMYQCGQALFVAATILTALANSLPMLLFARACQAVGVAGALSVGTALLRRVYPANQLAKGLGLNGIIIASASALSPSLGGFLLALGSWRLVFAAAAPFALLSLMLGRSLPTAPPTRSNFDVAGATLCAATFGLLMSGLQLAAHRAAALIYVPVMIAGSIVSALFVRRELSQRAPILPVDLLAIPAFALSILAALAAFTGSMIFTLSLPFLLQSALGFGPAKVGSIMAAWPLTMMATAPVAGMLLSRTPSGLLGSLGMLLTAGGLVLIGTMPPEPGLMRIVAPLMLGGAGFGLFMSPNSHQIMSAAPPERSASAGAMISTTRLVGSAFGATVLAVLLSNGVGSGAVPAFVAAGFVVIAAACSLLNLNRHAKLRKNSKTTDQTEASTGIF